MRIEKNKRRVRHRPSATTARFEKLLEGASDCPYYSLRLYITGTTARSSKAVANIRALCEEYLAGRYDLEIVDLYQQPGQAMVEQIIAAPTLIKKLPMPPRRLVGDFSDRDKVIVGLDLIIQEPGGGTREVEV